MCTIKTFWVHYLFDIRICRRHAIVDILFVASISLSFVVVAPIRAEYQSKLKKQINDTHMQRMALELKISLIKST